MTMQNLQTVVERHAGQQALETGTTEDMHPAVFRIFLTFFALKMAGLFLVFWGDRAATGMLVVSTLYGVMYYALWCHVFWPAALGAIDSAQGATVGGILEERGSHLHRCREWAKCPDPDLHRTLDGRFWCLGHVHDAEFLRIGEANRTLLQRISILFVAMGGATQASATCLKVETSRGKEVASEAYVLESNPGLLLKTRP